MEKIDRARRQEAGRKILVDAGVTDEKTIVDILGSPSAKLMANRQDEIGTPQRVLRDREPAPVLSPPRNDPDVRHGRNAEGFYPHPNARFQADREPESPDEFFSPRPNANARAMDRELFLVDVLPIPRRDLFDLEPAAPAAALSPRQNADHEPEAPAADLSPRPNANARPMDRELFDALPIPRRRPAHNFDARWHQRPGDLHHDFPKHSVYRRRAEEVDEDEDSDSDEDIQYQEPDAHVAANRQNVAREHNAANAPAAAAQRNKRPEVNAVVRGGAPRLNVASPRQPRRHISIAGVIKVSSREQDLHLRRQKREARPKPWQRDGVAPKAAARKPNIAPAHRHMNQGPKDIVPPANRQNRVPNNTIGLAVAQRANQTGFDNAEARDCLIM